VGRAETVIDLGCGPGVLLDEFRRGGWQRLAGIDPAPRAAEQASRLFGLETVRTGTLATAAAQLDLAEAGLVCLTGILEHLPSLRHDLAALAGHCAPQAKLLIEVPALERFLADRFEPFGEFSLEHLQYFSAASLCRLLGAQGFGPLALSLLPLPDGTTPSLLGLFARSAPPRRQPDDAGLIDEYVLRSEHGLRSALARATTCDAKRVVVYGAGSHSARILPALLERGLGPRLVALVDANPNLWGKTLGPLTIEPPEAVLRHRDATLLISTFRSQEAVAAALARRHPNPLLRLYC
jgi:SAM-dependent methyltransferase